jgi:hypothetical protein
VSVLAGLVVELLGSGFNGAGLSGAACMPESIGVERAAGAASDRLEFVTACLDEVVATFACSAGALASLALLRAAGGAAITGLSRVSVAAGATTAGAEALGAAVFGSVLCAIFTAGPGVLISLSLML